MVSRSFVNASNLTAINQGLAQTRSRVSGLILPTLGLSVAFSALGGGLNDATSSGRAASSAMYQLRTSTYGLQESITRLLLPGIELVTPLIGGIADRIVDADEATGGWSTGLGLAGLGVFVFGGKIVAAGRHLANFLRLSGRVPGALARIAAAAGGSALPIAAAAGFAGLAVAGLVQGDARAANAVQARTRELPVLGQAQEIGEAIAGFLFGNRGQSNIAQRGPISQIFNSFSITATSDEDLIPRIQNILDQGAIRPSN